MSNTLPMALLRPSCTAMRASAPATHQWNTVTQAFTRQFCSRASRLSTNPRPSLLSVLQFGEQHHGSQRPFRSFCSTAPRNAKVEDTNTITAPDAADVKLPSRKRQVKVGPLPEGMPHKQIIARIFGPNVSPLQGYNVLRILHHRRTSGSLVDYGVDNLGPLYGDITHEQAKRGLEWLRGKYPIDEARAAEEWAEKEANRIAYELWLADPDNADSKWNDPARVWAEKQQKEAEEAAKANQEEEYRIGMLRAGPSQFERNIAEKRQQRLEAAAKRAEEKEKKEKEMQELVATGKYLLTPGGTQLMKPGQTAYVDIFGREQVSRRNEEMAKWKERSVNKEYSTPEEMLAKTTLAQRLVPMTILVILTCLASLAYGHYYMPPTPEHRLWPDVSPTTATIAALIGINCFFCAAWRFMPVWPIMTRYFMHVPGYPRALQAIGNVFSHVQYEHLIANMMYLLLAGAVCHDLVGRGIFLGTYVSAGAVGTLASLYWANLGRGIITAHSVGASAAIWGISTLYLLLTDTETITIPFIKDMEVAFFPKLLLAAFVGLEVANAIRGRHKLNDHASHFGGIAVGASVAGYLHATGFMERRRRAMGGSVEPVLDPAGAVKAEVEGFKAGVKKVIDKEVPTK